MTKSRDQVRFIPIAPRKAKIVHNFGLSECNRVMKSICQVVKRKESVSGSPQFIKS